MKTLPVVLVTLLVAGACAPPQTSNDKQREAQEVQLDEANSAVGMPSLPNHREKRQLKDIYEMRDQDGLVTYTYLFNQMQGTLVFFCNSIGFGIPYATQYSASESVQRYVLPAYSGSGGHNYGVERLPQAEPNGLFPPADAEGTWVTCLGPDKQQHPVYVEPPIVSSPFPLTTKQ